MNIVTEKLCISCGEIKQISEFYSPKHNICKMCKIECVKIWYRKNILRKKEYDKSRRENKKEKILENRKRYYKENKEEILSKNKDYANLHKEKMREYKKDWKQKNPEKIREDCRNRRARIKGNGGILTQKEWEEILNKYGSRCLKCGSVERIEIDHVIPISLGGKNDKYNVQPLCRKCNASKNNKIEDYR